jgi:hypothetical protein
MTDSDDARREALTGATTSGALLTLGEAFVSIIPGAGGPVAKLLSVIREARDHRVADTILAVAHEQRATGHRLDAEFVKTTEFAQRFEATLEQVAQAGQNSKRDFYVRALTKLTAKDRPALQDWDFYTDTLNRVGLPHLRLLAAIVAADPALPLPANTDAQWEYLRTVAPDMAELTIARCWDDLANLGVMDTRNLVTTSVPTGVDPGDDVLTHFGKEFVQFLGMPAGPKRRRKPTRLSRKTSDHDRPRRSRNERRPGGDR